MDTPRVLLEHYLKQLRLPTMLREFPKLAEQCAKEGATFEQFLLRLVEQEMVDRERRAAERRIKAAKFPVTKSLETYDFLAVPSLNKKLVVELAHASGSAGERTCWPWETPAPAKPTSDWLWGWPPACRGSACDSPPQRRW